MRIIGQSERHRARSGEQSMTSEQYDQIKNAFALKEQAAKELEKAEEVLKTELPNNGVFYSIKDTSFFVSRKDNQITVKTTKMTPCLSDLIT